MWLFLPWSEWKFSGRHRFLITFGAKRILLTSHSIGFFSPCHYSFLHAILIARDCMGLTFLKIVFRSVTETLSLELLSIASFRVVSQEIKEYLKCPTPHLSSSITTVNHARIAFIAHKATRLCRTRYSKQFIIIIYYYTISGYAFNPANKSYRYFKITYPRTAQL